MVNNIAGNLFELQAKIKLDSKDYENGIREAEGKTGKFASGLKSKLGTAAKAGAVAVGAAFVAIVKKATESFAEYEQLVGGAQLMFGEAYDFIIDRSKKAYKTVQLSQNDYLKQVNGFATGLKNSLGGNEKAAAELADKIITAEADIVAATGNTQENVQNAFNGIMKGNYTMLDNLQIGIKPTKEGMQEVIDKVNDWRKAQGKAADLTIDSLADCEAAVVDYVEMQGMSGYAANEASDTVQGAIASMKGAWSNFVTGLAQDNADIEQLTTDLADSIVKVITNILPVVGKVLKTLGKMIYDAIVEFFDKAYKSMDAGLNNLAKRISKWFKGRLSDLKSTLSQLKSNAKAALSDFISTLSNAKEKMIAPFRTVKDKVKGFISDIKSFFSNLHLELPHIKVPHFKITGGKAPWGLGGKGTAPSIGIDWYAKAMNNAMLLDSPTIFGMANGKYLGAGEAGQEVVAGSDTLMAMIKGAVAETINSGAIVGLLSDIAVNTGAQTSININSREFGRLVKGVV